MLGIKKTRQLTFRVATLNWLGHSHTEPNGNKYGKFGRSSERTPRVVKVLKNHPHISVVLCQEFQSEQQKQFLDATDDMWGIHESIDNAVIWKKELWDCIERHFLEIPYFYGHMRKMPYVLLKHKKTGQLIWFYSSHNPANTRGEASQWRIAGWKKEAELFTLLNKTHPVVSGGDRNATYKNYSPWVRKARRVIIASAAIDYIEGSRNLKKLYEKVLRNERIQASTDHPLVIARIGLKYTVKTK